jgi:glycosyltransferase involved in cell wall biosynthesis
LKLDALALGVRERQAIARSRWGSIAPVRVAVLMPAFNEGERLEGTLRDLGARAREGGHRVTVFVVDDGSSPAIDPGIAPADGALRVILARHPVNLGQGAAIETARRLALEPRWDDGFEAWVTMDSDGQHRAVDALALAAAITGGADVALGDRFAGASEVPSSRRLLLRLARVFERWTTGLVLSDAHNGLRAFGSRAIVQMRLRQNRMAHATELTRKIGAAVRERPLVLVEVPVSVRYTAATLAKGQRAAGALAIVVDLFQGFLFGEPR